ncbi:MAG TPA: histidine phosphatase family protein [Aquabacterium sp.]|uniref:histidine phosphatase family protein n=1 Tax=Aquabacterium sp. TaxID=1872578 RepID=UPI002E33B3B8|nr:histidine phosphatase family protein [Aquabacterium sp.]HEX5356939.1 histidine phosphatase family protein [Aquabacterium sp.]
MAETTDMSSHQALCQVWRHPRPRGVAGRCIGRTDVPVDRRKAKRLAHRIRQQARRHGWPRVVHTSPLQRCALVGQILRSWGWRHLVDEALLEMDFGRWDGQRWADIHQPQVDAWCADFLHHPPGGAEALADVFRRVAQWVDRIGLDTQGDNHVPRLVVGHAGWMLSLQWQLERGGAPTLASQWPAPPGYGQCLTLGWPALASVAPGCAGQPEIGLGQLPHEHAAKAGEPAR